MMNTMIAPCGIDCQSCDAYKATQSQDIQLKEKLAAGYKEHFGKDIALEDLDCDGCNATGRHIGFCAECAIRSCATEKAYQTCAECADFPCSKGDFIWTEESKSKATLMQLRTHK